MVGISDFKFIDDYALESQLPYSVVGYIVGDCDNYVPPPGYVVTSCFNYAGNMIIGGNVHNNVSKIKVELQSESSSGAMIVVVGLAIVAVVGLLVLSRKYKMKSR
jgi:hypothetical protein